MAPAELKVLVVNCGSSSLKYDYCDTADPSNDARGIVERIGEAESGHRHTSRKGSLDAAIGAVDHAGALEAALAALTHPEHGTLAALSELTAVGHRVVHGGERFHEPTVINDEVLAEIRGNARFAPLHNPVNLLGVEAARRRLPAIPQVAVFDTAFHQTIPEHAYLYALPYEMYERERIRRYGFHGTSHHYVCLQAAKFLRRPLAELKLVTCHLGNGCSVCAVSNGCSIDTSMGMTPLEGLVMGTRCGDVDPAVVLHLIKGQGGSPDAVDRVLNRESGLLGISGISNDMREIKLAAEQGDRRAQLAIAIFCYRIRKYIGAYAAVLGGLDALVFTAGIGENDPTERASICRGFDFLGMRLDAAGNETPSLNADGVADVSSGDSRVRILVIRTDEQRMIALQTISALGHRNADEMLRGNG